MDTQTKAQVLASYVRSHDDFEIVQNMDGPYKHMGATIADAILQAGINYEAVVRPRIRRILTVYPDATSTSAFWQLLQDKGAKAVLDWKDDEKPNRVLRLMEFLLNEGIEDENDLSRWWGDESNKKRLLEIKGIGPKTVDYIGILVGRQTAAPDINLYKLLKECGINTSGYEETQLVFNCCADVLGVEPALFDHSVWRYMSHRKGP